MIIESSQIYQHTDHPDFHESYYSQTSGSGRGKLKATASAATQTITTSWPRCPQHHDNSLKLKILGPIKIIAMATDRISPSNNIGNKNKYKKFHFATKSALCIVISIFANINNAQQSDNWASSSSNKVFHRERVSWCTTNLLERRKCLDWARAIEDTNSHTYYGTEPFELNLDCVQGADNDQCMAMIDDDRADLMLLDPGEIGVAGRYHSLSPIMMEKYGPTKSELGHYSVAIVRKRSNINNLADLFGKKACFSGVNHMASWILPLASLVDLPQFNIADCNNIVKSASYFFGNSCAPNALINKFNPTGDNPQKMSALCDRREARVGAHNEPYDGIFSALKCLADPLSQLFGNSQPSIQSIPSSYLGGSNNQMNTNQQQQQLNNIPFGILGVENSRIADIAFLPHTTLFLAEKLNLTRELRAEIPARTELELLCPQGGRAPLERWHSCNFGFVPSHAVIVSSRTNPERRKTIQKFLKTSVDLFSSPSSPITPPLNDLAPQQQQLQRQQGNGPVNRYQAPSLASFDQFGTLFQQQQQQLDAFQTVRSSSLANQQQQQQPFSTLPINSIGNALNPSAPKISSDFKLTGDASLYTYPSLDVLFSSDMTDLSPLHGAAQTFKGYLNSFPVQLATTSNYLQSTVVNNNNNQNVNPYLYLTKPQLSQDNSVHEVRSQTDYFEKLRRCPVPAAILCVVSEKEFNKCLGMSKAFHAASLKPELQCKRAQSTLACMQLIKNRDADLVVLDAADISMAGARFNLIPILMEQIDLYEPLNYAVALAKKSDLNTDLFTLRTKNTCHSGFLRGAGWIRPMSFLLSNDRIRKYENCNSARSAAEHFERSCAPGILSTLSNIQNASTTNSWTIRNMCELCHGSGRNYCARDASEPFFGDTGALRCLVEGGGDVAFVTHTTIFENTGGSNRETWARNLIKSDFELLCRDGTRAPVNDFKACNLGTVPPNGIVTRGDTPFNLIDAYVNLFLYGQQYYGSKYTEEYTFKMFSSNNPEHDLIFQDSTQQLVRVALANQTYQSYLGHDFLRAMEIVFCN